MITLTKEQETISHRNRNALRAKLGIKGNANLVLHHIDPTLRYNDIERYIEWREEDITIMTRSEHQKLHCQLFMDDEYKNNMSDLKKGQEPWNRGVHYHFHKKRRGLTDEEKKKVSERFKGAKFTDEHKQKISESLKGRVGSSTGKHWYNNGVSETYAIDCPDGYVKGRLKRYADQSQIVSD